MEGFRTYERDPSNPKGFRIATLDELPPDEIYVLDTETTGLEGAPKDLVVDVGICRVSLRRGTVEDVYSSVLGYDVDMWDDYHRKAWIFENTDMTLEMVADAPPAMKVIEDVRKILRKRTVTAYNIAYDMDKFLFQEPWSMKGEFTLCNDIMLAATQVCKLPSQYHGRQYRYPKLDHAYASITEDDPAGIHCTQTHRALSDARMASYVMIQMFRDGTYEP